MENIFAQFVAEPINKDDATGVVDGSQKLHGPDGIFTEANVERSVVNTVKRTTGLVLPAFPTNQSDPVFAALTGYGEVVGAEPTTKCEPGPTPGTISIAKMMFPLGYKAFSSDTINPDELIMKKDRGDTDDMMLLGQLWSESAMAHSPGGEASNADVLNNAFALQMNGIARGYSRWLAKVQWRGTTVGATAGYQEPIGLDNLIKTGYVDPISTLAAPELNSEILDFSGENIVGGSNDIYQYMSFMEHQLYDKAERVGLNPVQWVIAMAPQLWHELTRVWPTLAFTESSASVPTGASNVVDGRTLYEARLALLQNRKLVINGREYLVAIDDGIVTSVTLGVITSDIYFVPMQILGGQYPATYWEYLNYTLIGSEIRSPITGKLRFWTDNGMYKWTIDERLGCFTVHATMQPRLLLRTPHLAGRIDNVAVEPLKVIASPLA